MRSLLAATALVAGCIGTNEGTTEIPVLDAQMFREEVQPILAGRCGNPSCHGRSERPFSIYSAGRLRADPARTFLDEPLTPEELAENYIGACAFALHVSSPADSLLLRKPLAVEAGGVGHLGGAVWTDDREPELRTVEAWIATAEEPR